eukprot:5798599-Prymnesium_polylepis.1
MVEDGDRFTVDDDILIKLAHLGRAIRNGWRRNRMGAESEGTFGCTKSDVTVTSVYAEGKNQKRCDRHIGSAKWEEEPLGEGCLL